MTVLDPPAAAARRQWAIDRLVEHLIGWGCPIEHAPGRAAELLDTVTAAGYALPTVLQPPPDPAPADPATARRHIAAIRADLTARRRRREGTPRPPQQDQQGSGISQHPPNRPSVTDGET